MYRYVIDLDWASMEWEVNKEPICPTWLLEHWHECLSATIDPALGQVSDLYVRAHELICDSMGITLQRLRVRFIADLPALVVSSNLVRVAIEGVARTYYFPDMHLRSLLVQSAR